MYTHKKMVLVTTMLMVVPCLFGANQFLDVIKAKIDTADTTLQHDITATWNPLSASGQKLIPVQYSSEAIILKKYVSEKFREYNQSKSYFVGIHLAKTFFTAVPGILCLGLSHAFLPHAIENIVDSADGVVCFIAFAGGFVYLKEAALTCYEIYERLYDMEYKRKFHDNYAFIHSLQIDNTMPRPCPIRKHNGLKVYGR